MSIKLSSTYSLITRTIKINGGPYAVKKKSTRNIWKYTLRDLAMNLIFTAFFFHLLFVESWEGERRVKNSSIHWNFSLDVMKKRKIFSWSKVELFKNIYYYKRPMDRLCSINLTFSLEMSSQSNETLGTVIPIYYF